MEFTYTLTEDDYLRAAAMRVPSFSRGPWSRVLSVSYIVVFYLSVGLLIVAGRMLEWLNLTGDKFGNLPLGDMLGSSIVPTAILPVAIFVLFKVIPFVPTRKARIEQFRRCIGCRVAVTAMLSPESIAFRSEAGRSECIWKCFAGWTAQDGLLILADHANTRHILKISGLDQAQHIEFMKILATALPKR